MQARAFSRIEGVVLLTGFLLAGHVGSWAFRSMWVQAELCQSRWAMRALADSIRVMPRHTSGENHSAQLRIDAARGGFQFVTIHQQPHGYQVETVERTFWLPAGLSVAEAPAVLDWPTQEPRSRRDIVVTAPAFERVFRVTIEETGRVKLDEEPTT